MLVRLLGLLQVLDYLLVLCCLLVRGISVVYKCASNKTSWIMKTFMRIRINKMASGIISLLLVVEEKVAIEIILMKEVCLLLPREEPHRLFLDIKIPTLLVQVHN